MKVEFKLDKQQAPTSDKGVKVVYGPAKRAGYKVRWYLLLALILSPLLVMGYFLYREYVQVGAPGIITVQPLTITAAGDGVVEAVYVHGGDNIEQGQALTTIRDHVVESDILFLRSELDHLTQSDAGQASLKPYQAQLADAQQNLKEVDAIKRRYDEYLASQRVSQIDHATAVNLYATAEQAVNQSQIELDQAKAELERNALAGPITQLRMNLQRELNRNLTLREQLVVTSPIAGSLVDIYVQPGQRIEKGDELATISDVSSPKIIAYLSPKYIRYAQVGTQASVRLPGGQTLLATVSQPTEMASKLPPQLAKPFEGQPALIKVTLSFDDELDNQHWVEGMPVDVRFSAASFVW
uniref:HlyD family secretion protein n=1 Tax=Thaumasiovibrio occultus TaxID=1891184 RepID=UPI000B3603F9|nr:HlyD family efflux transporter periplasmic adaptor subunit [Thaumasiovibrio occultus]